MLDFDRQQNSLLRGVQPARTGSRPARNHPFFAEQSALGNQAVMRFIQSCPLSLPGASICPYGGVCHACPARIKTKLRMGKPDDKYEREADRVADTVMRMPESMAKRSETVGLRIRGASLSGEEELKRQPLEGGEERAMGLQAGGVADHRIGVKSFQEQLTVSCREGQPLSKPLRDFFEPRFGQDFNQVQVHHGDGAAKMARSIKARAFTWGNDILFGMGQYEPGTATGRRLLAHELVHVVQQSAQEGRTSDPIQRQVDFDTDITNVTLTAGTGASLTDGNFRYHDAEFNADAVITATADSVSELNEWDVGVFQDLVGHWDRYYWQRANTDSRGRFVEEKYLPVGSRFRDQVNGTTSVWYADDEHQLLSSLIPVGMNGRMQVSTTVAHRDFPGGPEAVNGSSVTGMDASDGDRNINIQRTGGRFDVWVSAHNIVTDSWRHLRRLNWNYQRSLDFTGSGATLAVGPEVWVFGRHGPHGGGGDAPLMTGDTYNTVLNDDARYSCRRVDQWT